MAKRSSQILELARKGAEYRYQELNAEIAALVRDFPHLADQAGAALGRSTGRQGGSDRQAHCPSQSGHVSGGAEGRKREDESLLGCSASRPEKVDAEGSYDVALYQRGKAVKTGWQ